MDRWAHHNAVLSDSQAPWNVTQWVTPDPKEPKVYWPSTPTAVGSIPLSSLKGDNVTVQITIPAHKDVTLLTLVDLVLGVFPELEPTWDEEKEESVTFYRPDGSRFGQLFITDETDS